MGRLLAACILISSLSLTGCGGGGSSSSGGSSNSSNSTSGNTNNTNSAETNDANTPALLKPEFNRLWEVSDEEFLLISTNKAIWMQPDTDSNCYLVSNLDLDATSESSILLSSLTEGSFAMKFQEIDENNISISYQNASAEEITLFGNSDRSNWIALTPSQPLCQSNSAQSISTRISLVEVPSMVKIDR